MSNAIFDQLKDAFEKQGFGKAKDWQGLTRLRSSSENITAVLEFFNPVTQVFVRVEQRTDNKIYFRPVTYDELTWQAKECLEVSESGYAAKQPDAVPEKPDTSAARQAMNLPDVPDDASQAAKLYAKYLVERYEVENLDDDAMEDYLEELSDKAGAKLANEFVFSIWMDGIDIDDRRTGDDLTGDTLISVQISPKSYPNYDQHISHLNKILPAYFSEALEGTWAIFGEQKTAREVALEMQALGFDFDENFQNVYNPDITAPLKAALAQGSARPLSSADIKDELAKSGGGYAKHYKRLSKFKDANGDVTREFKNDLTGAFYKAVEKQDKGLEITPVDAAHLSPSALKKLSK